MGIATFNPQQGQKLLSWLMCPCVRKEALVLTDLRSLFRLTGEHPVINAQSTSCAA